MYSLTQRATMRVRAHLTGLIHRVKRLDYPEHCEVLAPNVETIDFLQTTGARNIAEIGIYEGDTTRLIAQYLGGEGCLWLFDFEERVRAVVDDLWARGYRNMLFSGNTHKTYDSYAWSLMRLVEQHPAPIWEYVFLDGKHTWDVDALAFVLIDKLLKPGGYLDFDDYHWSLARSTTMNPRVFPRVTTQYTREQIDATHVQLIVDLLVKRDPRYVEVVKDKIYQKVGA